MTLLFWIAMAGVDPLLQPGIFHGDEVSARNGSIWMALQATSSGQFLWRRARVSVKPVLDPVTGLNDAKQVTISGGAPLFLLPNYVPWMSKPPRQIVYPGPESQVDDSVLLDADTQLRLRENELLFQDFGTSQSLYRWPDSPKDERRSLLWAGDLDGDGRTDLLINVSEHHNVSRIRLYLSSKRTGGELVGLAAELFITGC